MAITKSILQNVRQQSVVKLINDGGSAGQSVSITLRELKLADETFLGETASNVNIQSVIFSSSDSSVNPIVIARGNTLSNAFIVGNVMYLHGVDSFDFAQGGGFHDKTLFNANISVLMPPQSLLYLVLGKTTGYQEPDQQTKF